jgi:hypothetical protein
MEPEGFQNLGSCCGAVFVDEPPRRSWRSIARAPGGSVPSIGSGVWGKESRFGRRRVYW